jgi:GntR family transcriptional regulator
MTGVTRHAEGLANSVPRFSREPMQGPIGRRRVGERLEWHCYNKVIFARMPLMIDRTSTVPLYSQIKQILIAEIQDVGRAAAPTLTEASLIKRFHVSRAPIRQALKELVDEGYVVRHRAKGTFPVQGVNVRLPPALELGGLSRYLVEQGLKPTSRVTCLKRVKAPKEVREALGLESIEKLLYLERVISVKGKPLVWTRTYLCTPPEFLPDVEELERVGTVFPLIEQALGIVFTRGEQHIWASGASEAEAEALDIDVGAPVLVAVTTLYTNEGRPGGWRRALHRADDFKYAFGLNR